MAENVVPLWAEVFHVSTLLTTVFSCQQYNKLLAFKCLIILIDLTRILELERRYVTAVT